MLLAAIGAEIVVGVTKCRYSINYLDGMILIALIRFASPAKQISRFARLPMATRHHDPNDRPGPFAHN